MTASPTSSETVHLAPLGSRGSSLAWTLANVALVLWCSILAFVVRREFFYFDDTPGGAVGQWYELGQQLLAGQWPVLNLEAWMAGHYLVEQWGLFNPPILAIALLTTRAPDLLVLSAAVKVAFLVVGALGVQYLARSVGVSTPWAAIAGASAALAGFTFSMDATTWVTQLMVWAWSGWAYGALIRWAHGGRALPVALVAGYLVVTVGYVHGTLFLVFFFVALLVHGFVDRAWPRIWRTLAVGLVLGLEALATYLPALLTSSVTVRTGGVWNTGFMTYTLNGLAVSAVPMASPDITGWWGRYAHAPLTYVAWFLPLLALVPVRVMLRHARSRLVLVVFGALSLALALGPSDLGVFRFPIRAMPWLAMVALVLTVRCFSGLTRADLRPGRTPVVLLLVGFGYYMALSANPYQGRWMLPLAAAMALASWVACRTAGDRLPRRLRGLGFAAVVGLLTVLVASVQVVGVARRDPGFGRQGFPSDPTVLAAAMPAGEGDAIVVGDMWQLPASERWSETSTGNLWYLVDHAQVMNLYSPSGFARFNEDLCMQTYYGGTCPELLDRLFRTDDRTGQPLVDLLGIDTIQVLADEDRPIEELIGLVPPPGWVRAQAGDVSVTWVREAGVQTLAGASWASPGMSLTTVAADDGRVRLRVDRVGPDGGLVVFPRLAWPGYTVAGGTLADPTRGYLLTVEVPGGTPPGSVVDVTFRPRGWYVQWACLALATLLSVVLLLSPRIRRGRLGRILVAR